MDATTRFEARKLLLGLGAALVLIATSLIAGTTGKIAGRITDKATNEPLVSANVIVAGTTLGASTDVEGYYSIINVPPGSYTLEIRLLGYQTYTLKGDSQGHTVIRMATALKAPPKDPAELPGLVPLLWEGDVYFQKTTGRYSGSRLTVKKEVPNHQGEGTKFVFESQLTEALAEN